jgi:hypothetical protein
MPKQVPLDPSSPDSSVFGYDTLIEESVFVELRGERIPSPPPPPLRIGMKVVLRGDTHGYIPGGFDPDDEAEILGFRKIGDYVADEVVQVRRMRDNQMEWVNPFNISRIISENGGQ